MYAAIELSVCSSSAPGCEWAAWLGFRPLSRGFSVLARYSEVTSSRGIRIARKYSSLDWRSACRSLLDVSEEWALDGDFLHQTEVVGLEGWRADLLAACWFGGEYQYRHEVEYLAAQTETTLDALAASFGGGLAGKECLESISEAIEHFGAESSVETICGKTAGVSRKSLLFAIQSAQATIDADIRLAEKKRNDVLGPFRDEISRLAGAAVALWPQPSGYASGLGFSYRKNVLRRSIDECVLRNGRLPNDDEFAKMVENARATTSFRF